MSVARPPGGADTTGGADTVHVADRLVAASERAGSLACVGIDPRPELIPETVRRAALARHGTTSRAVGAAFVEFATGILEAVAGHCAAVKPQLACFEAYGADGWEALAATVSHARELGLEVILDGKRNDIGSTAAHYQQGLLGAAPGLDGAPLPGLGGHWATVNAYLGFDGVEPFLAAQPGAHGVFVLVKTSNPSSGDLQDQPSGTGSVAETMARLVHLWGGGRTGRRGLSDVGAVVGATHPGHAAALRALLPDSVLLVPGYGTQGAGAADALAGARPAGRDGVVVNSSRAILGAWRAAGTDDYAAAARAALDAMNADLNAAR
ncbi:MAG: orotidine-5'-phosphate decarboxylase [Acidimicrobiia bacterium]|nr:orotidine-5'-phosphate decarboxylase [Acidimicrobiia bacterium]